MPSRWRLPMIRMCLRGVTDDPRFRPTRPRSGPSISSTPRTSTSPAPSAQSFRRSSPRTGSFHRCGFRTQRGRVLHTQSRGRAPSPVRVPARHPQSRHGRLLRIAREEEDPPNQVSLRWCEFLMCGSLVPGVFSRAIPVRIMLLFEFTFS